MRIEQGTGQHLKKRKERKSALTASRTSRIKYSQRNRKHCKESVEQKSAPRRDQCPSPPHLGAHHQEEQRREAPPAEGERAVPRTGPQSQEQLQKGAYRGRQAGEAHPVQSTGIPLPAGQGRPTVQTTTTTITDHHRSIRRRTAPLRQEGEPTSTQPAPLAPRWNKKRKNSSKTLVCNAYICKLLAL
jgi:hypothetical protein